MPSPNLHLLLPTVNVVLLHHGHQSDRTDCTKYWGMLPWWEVESRLLATKSQVKRCVWTVNNIKWWKDSLDPRSLLFYSYEHRLLSIRMHLLGLSSNQSTVFYLGVLAVILVLYAALTIFRLLNDPLRDIPGPFLARLTRLWLFNRVRERHIEREQIKLHQQYGT